MKLIYDISVLGVGQCHSRAKTGIFRVVENIAYGLIDLKECDLNFCATLSSNNINYVKDYLKENEKLERTPLICSKKQKIYQNISKAIDKINNQPKINVGSKVVRKALYCALKSFNPIYQSPNAKQLHCADIFHSPFYPLPKYSKSQKLKRVLTVYDLIPIMYPQFFEFKEDHLINKVVDSIKPNDWVICISNSTKNDLCNYRNDIEPSRVLVTHLAASELFYPCHNSENINSIKKKYNIPDTPYLLSLSTLEPRKNIDHTIRCFARLIEQEGIKDLYLVLVGTKGWDYDHIFAEISNLSALKDRIIVTGYVADEDLAALYSGAMAFVYPSFYEGFGLPPLEAMQCGIPVITSNTSSLPEVVGDAGIMVSPTDTDALCQSMLDIYLKSSLRETMSFKSRERAKKFSWEKCTQETIQVYKTALNS